MQMTLVGAGRRWTCAGCIGLSLMAAQGTAQATSAGERKSVRVVRIDEPPTIDGHLDEAVWQQAEVMSDFHQIRPGDGDEPSDPTEVYLLYDSDAFYIGARMFDSEPDRISAPTMRHGQGLRDDDRLVVILDPFNTGRGGFRFETNANGVRHDAIYQNVTSFQSEWSVIWEAAATIDETGWLAEMAIPFKSLPFDPTIDGWGFNFGRAIRRRGEETAWVSRNRSYNPSILGLATGMTGMDQGLGLDIVPSASVSERKSFSPALNDSDFDPSLDVFYRVTPSLNASLTINTDFSATEVDDRQVNLTRFSLFFPEKRDFFLNDSDLFEFGRITSRGFSNANSASSPANRENGRPFFSRRLGLSATTGTPVDLNYGGKLSGRVGRWNLGVLAIQQDAFESLDATNAFVGRVTANVLAESAVGLIVTDGDPNANRDNSVVGLDFRYLNTRLPGGRSLEADAWVQSSDTEGVEGEDSAFGFGVSIPSLAGIRAGFAVKEVESNFNPALGFVSRSNVRDMTVNLGYTHFIRGGFVQSIFTGFDAQRIDFLDGGLQSETIVGRLLEVQNNSQDRAQVRYFASKEVITQPFTIYSDQTRDVVIPVGRYSFNEQLAEIQTGGQRKFATRLKYRWGDFFDGKRTNVGSEFSWNRSRNFQLTLNYDWNDIELPQGEFISRLVGLTSDVSFSSTLSWVTLIQYDNLSELLGINTRLHWIPTAGQEGFIVLNHDLQDFDKDNSFNSQLADLSIKFNYTFRF